MQAHDFDTGQIWRYQTRPGEEASRLYIVKSHEFAGTMTFHICADGLAIRNPLCAGGRQEMLPYAPVSRETLESSVTELVAQNAEMPDISEHFESWKKEAETAGAGVFTISVAEIIDLIEQAVARHGLEPNHGQN